MVVASLASAAVGGDQQAPAFLHQYIRASDAELRRLERGEPITRTLHSADGSEIATVGAIRVRCTADTFVARVRDVERFKASEYLLQIGRFSSPPVIEDVATLEMDASDRQELRGCLPGACPLRLPAADMLSMRDAIPWGSPGEAASATAQMRALIAREAQAYVAGGSAALADYADQETALPRAAAFRGLLRHSAFKAEFQAEIFGFLDRYPNGDLQGAESVLYWSRERFGLKPVTNITHTAILRRDDVVVFASKQVYTTHYFDASLGMAIFIAAPGGQHGYVTYMNRSRVEGIRGPLAGVIRGVASRRGRDGLAKTLLDVRKKLEG